MAKAIQRNEEPAYRSSLARGSGIAGNQARQPSRPRIQRHDGAGPAARIMPSPRPQVCESRIVSRMLPYA